VERKTGFVYVALSAIILAIGLIASAYMLSRFFVKIEKDKLLCVKGFSEKIVKSDVGYFTFTISTKSDSLSNCYKQMNESMALAVKQLKEDGFKEEEISKENFYNHPVYKKEKGKDTNILLYYNLRQNVKVKSDNVDLINKKYKNLNSLLGKNIDIFVNSPSYFISDLNKYKIELLAKATENAKLRAKTIAGNSGADIGKVIWAQQGVIQITAPLSTETSSYGIYDTSSLKKAIKIVVTLKFTVDE
jgi:hypothetical protein